MLRNTFHVVNYVCFLLLVPLHVEGLSYCSNVSYNPDEARLYMQYARVACCDRPVVEHWDCGDMCDATHVRSGGVRYLPRSQTWQVQGYVAQLPDIGSSDVARTHTKCVVAIRGSVDPMNWLNDAVAWTTEWPNWDGANSTLCPGCQVHSGFAHSYRELRDSMIAAIRDLRCDSLSFAGHSLGAALVTLASLDARMYLGFHVDQVWTFGKPRVGNMPFVNAYIKAAQDQGVKPPLWRLVHHNDPVPRMSPDPTLFKGIRGHTFAPYVHEPCEVYYYEEVSTATSPYGAFQLCKSSSTELEDLSCSVSTSYSETVKNIRHDHDDYMNLTIFADDLPLTCISQKTRDSRAAEERQYIIILVLVATLSLCACICFLKRCKASTAQARMLQVRGCSPLRASLSDALLE